METAIDIQSARNRSVRVSVEIIALSRSRPSQRIKHIRADTETPKSRQ
jgi:hypothetical protein